MIGNWFTSRTSQSPQPEVTPPARVLTAIDPFATGVFPLSPVTHDLGLARLFDLAAALTLLGCRPGDRVLDLGAGSGFSSEMLARFGYDVVPIDPDRTALMHNRRRVTLDAGRVAGTVRVAQAIAERLPFVDGTFDGVLGLNVMHHVEDLPLALRELARVMRPGARAVFCEPGLDHLGAVETQKAIREHGENDQPFDALAFLDTAHASGFTSSYLPGTLHPSLTLIPHERLEQYRAGAWLHPPLTPVGVIDELQRRHAFALLVRDGDRPRTSRHPGRLARTLDVRGLPPRVAGGDTVECELDIVNTGDTLWLSRPTPLGGYVSVGCKLLRADGRLIDDLLGRTDLPRDVAPGERLTVAVRFAMPRDLPTGAYHLEVDLVDELICWFADLDRRQALVAPLNVG